jgi:hypothetical protein
MKVNVTDSDINMGIQGSFCYCPIALALKRKGLIDVSVYPDHVNFIKLNVDKTMDWYDYTLPEEAQMFIQDYDDSGDDIDAYVIDFELTALRNKQRVSIVDNVIQEIN